MPDITITSVGAPSRTVAVSGSVIIPESGMVILLDERNMVGTGADNVMVSWKNQKANEYFYPPVAADNKPWVANNYVNGHPALKFRDVAAFNYGCLAYLDRGAGNAYNITEATMAMVFKIDTSIGTRQSYILFECASALQVDGFGLAARGTGTVWRKYTEGTSVSLTDVTDQLDNQWAVVVVSAKFSPTREAKLYINGDLVKTDTAWGLNQTLSWRYIGLGNFPPVPEQADPLCGYIASFMMWNRALSATECGTVYANLAAKYGIA